MTHFFFLLEMMLDLYRVTFPLLLVPSVTKVRVKNAICVPESTHTDVSSFAVLLLLLLKYQVKTPETGVFVDQKH